MALHCAKAPLVRAGAGHGPTPALRPCERGQPVRAGVWLSPPAGTLDGGEGNSAQDDTAFMASQQRTTNSYQLPTKSYRLSTKS
jgi:hypothetical protein